MGFLRAGSGRVLVSDFRDRTAQCRHTEPCYGVAKRLNAFFTHLTKRPMLPPSVVGRRMSVNSMPYVFAQKAIQLPPPTHCGIKRDACLGKKKTPVRTAPAQTSRNGGTQHVVESGWRVPFLCVLRALSNPQATTYRQQPTAEAPFQRHRPCGTCRGRRDGSRRWRLRCRRPGGVRLRDSGDS